MRALPATMIQISSPFAPLLNPRFRPSYHRVLSRATWSGVVLPNRRGTGGALLCTAFEERSTRGSALPFYLVCGQC
jgi:hypothetical protein